MIHIFWTSKSKLTAACDQRIGRIDSESETPSVVADPENEGMIERVPIEYKGGNGNQVKHWRVLDKKIEQADTDRIIKAILNESKSATLARRA